uniref:Uncharacterized protein n=1 Tax=Neobodo designis TaxID=312471 RepID=A0A7S1M5P2_NEODS
MSGDWRTSTLPRSFDAFAERNHSLSDDSPRSKARARASGPPKYGLEVTQASKSLASPDEVRPRSRVLEAVIMARRRLTEVTSERTMSLDPHVIDHAESNAASESRDSKRRIELPLALKQRLSRPAPNAMPNAMRVQVARSRSRQRRLPQVPSERTNELARPRLPTQSPTTTAYDAFRRERIEKDREHSELAADCRRVHLPLSLC